MLAGSRASPHRSVTLTRSEPPRTPSLARAAGPPKDLRALPGDLARGIIVVQGRRKLEQELVALIDEKRGAGLSERLVKLIEDMRLQWKELDRRIGEFDAEFAAFAKTREDARLLLSIPGIGALIASALIAAVGKAEAIEHGRDFSAWLGLVPRQSTTGGKPKLMGISKRGNKSLRKLLIHGARSALWHQVQKNTPLVLLRHELSWQAIFAGRISLQHGH
jgi:transposase